MPDQSVSIVHIGFATNMARMLANPVVSALIIQSGDRADSYRNRDQHEHERWHGRLKQPGFEQELLGVIAGGLSRQSHCDIRYNLRQLIASVARRILYAVGLWPPSPGYWLRFWRKGSFVRRLRKIRGLE